MRVMLGTTFARRAPGSGTVVSLQRLSAALAELPEVDLIEVANARRQGPGGGGMASVRNLLTGSSASADWCAPRSSAEPFQHAFTLTPTLWPLRRSVEVSS
jgi:hypothetical protein